MKGPAVTFREVVALILLGLFAWAFLRNPHDQAIIGALLTGFATAYGFYLGGSKVGSDTAAKNADTVAAQAQAATDNASGPQPVIVTNPPEDPANVQEAPK